MLTLAGSSRAAQAARGRGGDAGTPVSPWPSCGGDRLPFPALGQTQVLTAAFREGLLSLCTAPPYTAASFCSFSAALASPLGSNWVLRGLTSLFFFPWMAPNMCFAYCPQGNPLWSFGGMPPAGPTASRIPTPVLMRGRVNSSDLLPGRISRCP